MGDRPAGFRLAVGLIALILLVIEVQALVAAFQYQTILQQRALGRARQGFLAVRPLVESAMQPGGPAAWNDAARVVLAAGLAAEVDFFDPRGERLLSLPSASLTAHWPEAEILATLRPEGPILVVGPFVKPAPRILTYATFASKEGAVVLRLSATADELASDLRERRPILVGHGLALGLLALLGGLAILPPHRGRPTAPAPALGAYEQTMARLRDQGEVRSREHEVEKRRMEDIARDREPMARAGELTAGMVHEVRNGLGTIVGYARLMEKGSVASTGQEAALGILDECRTLEVVVRRFMDFVRDESLNLVPFDMGRLLSRVAARESRSGPGGDVRLAELGGLPALVGDEELLERAFENLIRNGREAAGPQGHVLVTAWPDPDGRLAVGVADDGPGIPSERLGSVQPFYTTKAGGLGLGLPMAQKIVRLHEGDLELKGRSPRGLEVVVRLPLRGPRLDRDVTFGSEREPGSRALDPAPDKDSSL